MTPQLSRALSPAQSRDFQFDQLPHNLMGARSLRRFMGEHPLDQASEREGKERQLSTDVGRRIAGMPTECLIDRSRRKGQLADQHFKEHRPKAENIAGLVGVGVGSAQLRREVIRGAENVSATQEGGILSGTVRETEIDQDGAAVLDEMDVVGLHIAVQESGAMQGGQGLGRLPANPQCGRRVE